MLVAAAVCPHPPLLIPAALGGAGQPDNDHARALRQVQEACFAVAADLIRAKPDLIVVVGGGPATVRYDGAAAGSLADFGIPFVTGSGVPVLPLSLTVGAWLIRAALAADRGGNLGRPGSLGGDGSPNQDGAASPNHGGAANSNQGGSLDRDEGPGQDRQPELRLNAVARNTAPAGCLRLGAQLAGDAARVALLVMGDASARRVAGVPGAPDPAADRYDGEVAAALAAGDPGRLAQLDPALDDELMIAGRAAWQVMAGAAQDSQIRGTLRSAAAPYDVSYLVASWECSPRPTLTH